MSERCYLCQHFTWQRAHRNSDFTGCRRMLVRVLSAVVIALHISWSNAVCLSRNWPVWHTETCNLACADLLINPPKTRSVWPTLLVTIPPQKKHPNGAWMGILNPAGIVDNAIQQTSLQTNASFTPHCLSCLVGVGGVNWLGESQDCRRQKVSKLNMFSFFAVLSCLEMRCELSFVFSRPSFQLADGLNKTIQSQIYWGLLKTVLSCRQFSSHRRHGQDKTALSCLVRVGGVN